MAFKETELLTDRLNPFSLIGEDWFLLTAGNESGFNTMTASWGSMGILWGKPVFTTVVRTSRHTLKFLDESPSFSISFFDKSFRKDLSYCGTHSGRDVDKLANISLTPTFIDGIPAFEEANRIFLCRKLFRAEMTEENFIDKSLLAFYQKDGFHINFTGEIFKSFAKGE